MKFLKQTMTYAATGAMVFLLTACTTFALQGQDRNNLVENVFTFPQHDAQGNEIAPAVLVEEAEASLSTSVTGAIMGIHGYNLPPGDAVTSWWVIFNNPEFCTDGVCSEDDVLPAPGNVAAGVSVLYGDGRIINPQGSAFFWGALEVGDVSGAVFGPGLTNPLGAEIHYVLRTHGPARQDVLAEQLTTLLGGCAAEAPHAPCEDLQFAVFKQVP